MNKKYNRTDQERDQSRRLEQGEAESQKARQVGMKERGQQQSRDETRQQQGGWATDEKGRAERRHLNHDRDSGENVVDEL